VISAFIITFLRPPTDTLKDLRDIPIRGLTRGVYHIMATSRTYVQQRGGRTCLYVQTTSPQIFSDSVCCGWRSQRQTLHGKMVVMIVRP
jgi:hypothetical protein